MDRLKRRASKLGLDISTERIGVNRQAYTALSERVADNLDDKGESKEASKAYFVWPTSPRTTNLSTSPNAPRLKYIPIEIAHYYGSVTHLNCDEALPVAPSHSSPQLQRHIPIIIPQFAEPFTPKSVCPTLRPQAGNASNATTFGAQYNLHRC